MNRRRFVLITSAGVAGGALTACGNDSVQTTDLSPTMIPDVAGAPPTLAPNATPPDTSGAASGGAQPADGEQAAGGEQAGLQPIMLEAQDPYDWSETELQAAPGQIIRATNVGVLEHNFTVDELGIAQDLPPGEPVDVTVPEDAAVGESFEFYCSVPGHREGGMVGQLAIVEPGAAGDAAASPAASPEAQEAPPEPEEAEAAVESGGAAVVLEAQDPADWSQYEFSVSAGQIIEVTNVGFAQHDFTVDEWGISENLPPGEPVAITVPDTVQPGETYVFYCSVPGHRQLGMEGTLTIV